MGFILGYSTVLVGGCSATRYVLTNRTRAKIFVGLGARIFVRKHYLFRDVSSFPIAELEENGKLRGTADVCGQMKEHNFEPKGGYCVYYPSYILRTMFMNGQLFAAWDGYLLVFSGTTQGTNKRVPYSVTIPKRSLILNLI